VSVWPHRRTDDLFIDTTRVKTTFGCCSGVLTLAKGSRFDCGHQRKLRPVRVVGGEEVNRDGRRFIRPQDRVLVVHFEKAPGAVYPLSVLTRLQTPTKPGYYQIMASQLGEGGVTVGGASVGYRVTDR
jgi:hypothetical protein